MPTKYQKSFEELEKVASKFWPAEVSEKEATLSVIPLLIDTQDQFISILSVETESFEKLLEVVGAATIPSNLFLKHLVILADFGGEMLQRISAEYGSLFPKGTLNYYWRGEQKTYAFKSLAETKLTNTRLKIDGKKLFEDCDFDDIQKDTIALLLFAGTTGNGDKEVTSALGKCMIGDLLGKPDELTKFIKQRYIWVSRITGGATANTLGQIAQDFVAKYISEHLNVSVQRGGRLPNVTHTDAETGRPTSFDLVVSKNDKYVAIEVSFQVTTNSVIERKAGQARSRYEQVQKAGHRIAYVLDGAGNFQRETALRIICAHSDCTVAFSSSELDALCAFIRETLELK